MKVRLSRWGNSLGLRVPRGIAAELRLAEGSQVEVALDAKGRVLVTPARRRYTLDQLLRQRGRKARRGGEERAWIEAPRASRELI